MYTLRRRLRPSRLSKLQTIHLLGQSSELTCHLLLAARLCHGALFYFLFLHLSLDVLHNTLRCAVLRLYPSNSMPHHTVTVNSILVNTQPGAVSPVRSIIAHSCTHIPRFRVFVAPPLG